MGRGEAVMDRSKIQWKMLKNVINKTIYSC